jgi:ribosomal protein S18 acetylase RimI-like enzyme
MRHSSSLASPLDSSAAPSATATAQVVSQRGERMRPKLRMATANDARKIATLMDLSSNGGLSYLWGKFALRSEDWRDVAVAEILEPGSELALVNIVIVEVAGKLAGMAVMNGLSDEFTNIDISMLPTESQPLYSILKAAPGHLLVREIAVFPRFRGQGCGHALMIAAESIAEDKGFPGIVLNVHETNLGAKRLYESHGFVPVTECSARGHPVYEPSSRWITMTRKI